MLTRLLPSVFAIFMATGAGAATVFQFDSGLYTQAEFIDGTVAPGVPYNTAMRATGDITVAETLVPNMVTYPNLTITGVTLSDGINTFSGPPTFSSLRVLTDASAAVTALGFQIIYGGGAGAIQTIVSGGFVLPGNSAGFAPGIEVTAEQRLCRPDSPGLLCTVGGSDGEPFFVQFARSAGDGVSFDVSVAVVPLPAGGILLLGALAALAVAHRRRAAG